MEQEQPVPIADPVLPEGTKRARLGPGAYSEKKLQSRDGTGK